MEDQFSVGICYDRLVVTGITDTYLAPCFNRECKVF